MGIVPQVVVWKSHKLGTFVAPPATLSASCSAEVQVKTKSLKSISTSAVSEGQSTRIFAFITFLFYSVSFAWPLRSHAHAISKKLLEVWKLRVSGDSSLQYREAELLDVTFRKFLHYVVRNLLKIVVAILIRCTNSAMRPSYTRHRASFSREKFRNET